jgi:hypothetical protein
MNHDDASDPFAAHVRRLISEGRISEQEGEQLLGSARLGCSSGQAARLLDIDLPAGQIELLGEEGCTAPEVIWCDREVSLQGVAGSWTLRLPAGMAPQYPWDWFGWTERGLKLKMRLPPDLALLRVRQNAGSLRVGGLRGRVEARLLAGDVDLDGVHGFSLETKAGDIRASALITSGAHQIRSLAGQVTLGLLAGSSCELSAAVRAGRLTASGLDHQAGGWMGQEYRARLGAGAGQVEVQLLAGDLTLHA